MAEAQSKNKRIMVNTLIMYGRMFVFLILSLYTSRIVLNTLGFDNFGIYNVVGSVIVFFSFLNNGLSLATKRFITAEIENSDKSRVNHIFNCCIQSHILISIAILVIAETVGLYLVNYVLNIPPNRLYAANWAFQLSVITTVLNVIQSPFGVLLLAHENMGIYAYFTILDVILKLVIVFVVQILPGDILISYSILLFCVSIVSMIVYRIYTYKKYPECRRIEFKVDKPKLKEIFSFTSWSLAGQAAVVGTNEGVSVLVNVYYGVIVNAAMGVSNSVTAIVQNFVSNFQTAFNPQIIKSYTSKDYTYLTNLIIRASKLSSFLIILFTIPIIFEIDKVLELWLGEYPHYTVQFCVLVLVANYFEALAAPLWMVVYSQSNIKNYQIAVSTIYSLNFFVGWVLLFVGMQPYWVIGVRIAVFFILLFVRMYFTKKFFSLFSVRRWITSVLGTGLTIIVISYTVTALVANTLPEMNKFLSVIIVSTISALTSCFCFFTIGLSKSEQSYFINIVKGKFLKFNFVKSK